MVYFSERKKKRRQRITYIVVGTLMALSLVTVAALVVNQAVMAKYGLSETIQVDDEEAVRTMFSDIASQGYVYGHGPVGMYQKFYQMAVNKASKFYTPGNRFLHVTRFAEAGYASVIDANIDPGNDPNYVSLLNVDADTLNSVAWLDISREPAVVYCPDTGGNYYSVEIIDFYNNLCGSFYLRPGDISERNFIITREDYEEKVPSDTEQIVAETNYVLCYVRLMVPSSSETDAMKKIQQKFDIRPLSLHQDTKNPYTGIVYDYPRVEVNDALSFYNALSLVLSIVEPPERDQGILDLLEKIGVIPGGVLTKEVFLENEYEGILEGYNNGRMLMAYTEKTMDVALPGGFTSIDGAGAYDGDYYKRSALLKYGLISYEPQNFLMLTARSDGMGQFLHGESGYEIRFSSLPPSDAGYSVTLYRADEDPSVDNTLVANEMNVYHLGSRSNALKVRPDGSLTIYVSATAPEDKTLINNWLPAPEDNFYLKLRIYLPDEVILSGNWQYPEIVKVT